MNSIGSWKHKFDRRLEKTMHLLESIIAAFAMLVLVYVMCMMMWGVISHPGHLLENEGLNHFLHELLTIVVGFEFVKLLMHLTPGNILEVLTMALSRGIIVNHGSAVENLMSIACIIALFAAKRYLIPRAELNKEMDETVPEPHHHRGHRKHKHKHDEEHAHEERREEVH